MAKTKNIFLNKLAVLLLFCSNAYAQTADYVVSTDGSGSASLRAGLAAGSGATDTPWVISIGGDIAGLDVGTLGNITGSMNIIGETVMRTIDLGGTTRFNFTGTANSRTSRLENIKIINSIIGQSAITSTHNLTLHNIEISGSSATVNGGAINNTGTLTITGNATFTGNSATGTNNSGGAINGAVTIDAETVTFTGNTAGRNGGAISGLTNITASGDILFEGNEAQGLYDAFSSSGGGAIYGSNANPNSITSTGGNISFIGNKVTVSVGRFDGGALGGDTGTVWNLSAANGTILFRDNTNSRRNGGAISAVTNIMNALKVEFLNNESGGNGGAIYGATTITDVGDVTFSGNSAQVSGAIAGLTNITASGNILFEDNTATNGGGGAISGSGAAIIHAITSTAGNISFINNKALQPTLPSGVNGGALRNGLWNLSAANGLILFQDNISNGDGGAVFNDIEIIAAKTLTFSGNKANRTGGAIDGVTTIGNVANVEFLNNSAGTEAQEATETTEAIPAILGNGGAIDGNVTMTNVGNVTFSGNKATNNGGAINGTTNITASGDILFENNTAANSSGAINSASATITSTDGNISFIGNESKAITSNTGGGAIGGRIGTIELSAAKGNILFQDNIAALHGGAIYSNTAILTAVNDILFQENIAERSGGGIQIAGVAPTQITSTEGNVSFIGNAAKTITNNEGGGAIGGGTSRNVELSSPKGNILFENNTSYVHGGAIYANTNIHDALRLEFRNNSAGRQAQEATEDTPAIPLSLGEGGAIRGNTVAITDVGTVIFSGNKARGGNGGAISSYINTSTGTTTITGAKNVTFSNNTSALSGGAIESGGGVTIQAENVTFSENTAGNLGGAIRAPTTILATGDVLFENNTGVRGGAIDGATNITAGSITFTGNTATATTSGEGGAISLGNGENLIKSTAGDIVFTDNTSFTAGGAIGRYYTTTSPVLIFDASGYDILFDSNKALGLNVDSQGGAILNSTVTTFQNAGNLTFSNNLANGHGGAVSGGLTINNVENVIFSNNSAGREAQEATEETPAVTAINAQGGAISGITNITNTQTVIFSNNSATTTGGAIHNTGVSTIAAATIFTGNKSGTTGGAINNIGGRTFNLDSSSGDIIFTGNTANNTTTAIANGINNLGTLNINGTANAVVINDGITGSGVISKTNDGALIFATGSLANAYTGRLTQDGGLVKFGTQLFNQDITVNGGTFEMATGSSWMGTRKILLAENATMDISTDDDNIVLSSNNLAIGTGTTYGDIVKTGDGILTIGTGLGTYTNQFTNEKGVTNLTSTMFNQQAIINGGQFNIKDGGAFATNTVFAIADGGVVDFQNTGTGASAFVLDADRFIGSEGTYGDIYKTGSGDLRIVGNNSAFKGDFIQTVGKTEVTIDGLIFGGTNLIKAGILDVISDSSNYKVTLGSSADGTTAQLFHRANSTTIQNVGGESAVFNFDGAGSTATFGRSDAMGTTLAEYNLQSKIDNGEENFVIFENSKLTFGDSADTSDTKTLDFTGATKYTVNNSIIDLTGNGNSIDTVNFSSLETSGSSLLFDMKFAFDGLVTTVTNDILNAGSSTSQIALGAIRLLDDKDNGVNMEYTQKVLDGGLTFSSIENAPLSLSTTAYEYSVIVDPTDASRLILKVTGAADEYSLNRQNMMGGIRSFNFSEAGEQVYHNASHLNPMAWGDFTVLGYGANPNNSIIDGYLAADGVVSDKRGSMFDIQDGSGVNTFTMKDVTVRNAFIDDVNEEMAYKKDSEETFDYVRNGNGSVLRLDNADTNVYFENVVLHDNESTNNGGAIWVNQGALSILDSQINDNNAGLAGGAIYNNSLGNEPDGYGIIIASSAKETSFNGNTAGTDGGAIYNTGRIAVISDDSFDISFIGNTATTGSGGAVYNAEGAVFDVRALGSGVSISNNTAGADGGAIYNAGDVSLLAYQNDITVSGNTAGNLGGAIYNSGNLTLEGDLDSKVEFSNNNDKDGGNDIYNDGGNIYITGGLGEVIVNNGIKGTGLIDKDAVGVFRINGDSSGYSGDFTQSAGQTIFTDKFFSGNTIISSGILELAQGGELSSGGVLNMGAGTLFKMSSNANMSLSDAQLKGYDGGFGSVQKTGNGTLIIYGDFSAYDGNFYQEAGKTIVGAGDKIFGAINYITGGNLEITGGAVDFTVHVGTEEAGVNIGSFTHLSNTADNLVISTDNAAFLSGEKGAVGSNMTFASALAEGRANYTLASDIQNGASNTILFKDSVLKLGEVLTFNGSTAYTVNNVNLDLRNSVEESVVFRDLNVQNGSVLSFDINLADDGSGNVVLTGDKLTLGNTGQTIGLGNVVLVNKFDRGLATTYTTKVLNNALFNSLRENTQNVLSDVYEYTVGVDTTDASKIVLNAIGFADEYSLNAQNIKDGTRSFDFHVYDTTENPDPIIYQIGKSLDPTEAGIFTVLGRDSDATLSVISGELKDGSGNGSLFNINGVTDITIKDLTITGAKTSGYGSVLRMNNAASTALFENTIITGNEALLNGGAIFINAGEITINNSIFSDNKAGGAGAAIALNSKGVIVNINDGSLFSNNITTGPGGGVITNGGTVNISGGVTFSDNIGGSSGGISNSSTGVLNLTSSDGKDIIFRNNKMVGNIKRDILADGIVLIDGAAGTVSLDGGFRGGGTITKSNDGILALELGSYSSSYTGAFHQTGGTTNVAGVFFGGNNEITEGVVNFNDGSSLAATGVTDIQNNGLVNINHTTGNEFTVNGQLMGYGTIEKTAGGTLILTGDNSGFEGIFNQEAGKTRVQGTLFDTTANIINGTIDLEDGTAFATNSKIALNAGTTMEIKNTNAYDLTIDASNLDGYNGTFGAINKTGNGLLTLTGDNSSNGSIFTQTNGKTLIDASAGDTLFGTTAASNLINGGELDIIVGANENFNQNATLNGGALTYLSNTGDRLLINPDNMTRLLVTAPNSVITFKSETPSIRSKYELNAPMTSTNLGTGTTIAFDNSDVTFGATDFTGGSTIYSFNNSIIDLSSEDGSADDYSFKNITISGDTSLNLDVKFNKEDPHAEVVLEADKLIDTSNSMQTIELGQIRFWDAYDDGSQANHSVVVLDGLQFESAQQIAYATTIHKYIVTTTSSNNDGILDQLTIDHEGLSDSDSLYEMNDLYGMRVFTFSHYEDGAVVPNPYYISKSLDETKAGNFLVSGSGSDASESVISGYLNKNMGTEENPDWQLTTDRGSFFKLTDTAEETTLIIQDITIRDAQGVEGSVVFSDSELADTILNNVIITENESSGNGGAIYNNSGTVTIGSGDFNNNSSTGGLGGAIYNNDTLVLAVNGGESLDFSNNSDSNGANDIYNTGVININSASTGEININSGIAGTGEINMNSGILNLHVDSSGYLGEYNHNGGVTNVFDKFFESGTTVSGGLIDIQEGGSVNAGTITVEGGGVEFQSGSLFNGGEIITTDDGTLLWSGTADKSSSAILTAEDGTIGVIDNSILNLNNSSDTILSDASVYIEEGSTINNLEGTVALGNEVGIDGTYYNESSTTFDEFQKDFGTGTGEYIQNVGGTTTLINDSYIRLGGNTDISAGTLTIGSETQISGSTLEVVEGTEIVSDLNVNILDDNRLYVNGGTAMLGGAGDSWSADGTVYLSEGVLNLEDLQNGNGIILADGGELNLNSGEMSVQNGSRITTEAQVNIADGTTMNIGNDGEFVLDEQDAWLGLVNLEDGRLILNEVVNDGTVSTLNQIGGSLELVNNSEFSVGGNNVMITGGTVGIASGSTLFLNQEAVFENANLHMGYGTVNAQTGNIENYNLGSLTVDGRADFKIDIDGLAGLSDSFSFTEILGSGTVNVSDFSLLTFPTQKETVLTVFDVNGQKVASGIDFTTTAAELVTKQASYNIISLNNGQYMLTYKSDSATPPSYRGEVATMAVLSNQILVNNTLLDHIYLDSNQLSDSAIVAPYQLSTLKGSVWTKSYVAREKLSMTNDLNVNNDAYGQVIGIDFPTLEQNGWKFIPTAYVAYNGGRQKFEHVAMYQQGGQGGFMGTLSKGNLMASILAYVGGYDNKMSVEGVIDRTSNWFAGTVLKTAYNFHYNRNFVIQPGIMASYNVFGNQSFDSQFGNARMKVGQLNELNVTPSLNLIYVNKDWSLYGTANYNFYMNDQVNGSMSDIKLSEIEMRHDFIEYGFGGTKTWEESLTAWGQFTVRNGGRSGIGFQAGLSLKF